MILCIERIHQFHGLSISLLFPGSRNMGDAESRRNAKAEEEAWANVNRRQQKKFADLPRFKLDVTGGAGAFREVIRQRDGYFKQIASCMLEGVPVTVPMSETGNDTHHMVALVSPKATDEGTDPNDIVAVELLFRNYDNYYTAFRPIKRCHRENDPSGWFHFNDTPVPTFLLRDLRNKLNVFCLPFPCAYTGEKVKVGHDSLLSMFSSYSKVTRNNFHEVKKVAQTTMIFLGEGQRFPEILDELTRRMVVGIIEILQHRLDRYINQWDVFSSRAFKHALGVAGQLQFLEDRYEFILHVGDEYRLSLFVGPKISLLNYNDVDTDQDAPTFSSYIGVVLDQTLGVLYQACFTTKVLMPVIRI